VTRTFLWLHGLGWTAFCVSAYLNALPTLAPGQHGPMLAAKSLRTAIGCVLSALLYVGIQRLRSTNPPLPLLLAIVIASAGLLGPVWLSLYWLVSAPIRGDALPLTDWTRFPSAVLDYSFILLAWSLAGLGVQEWAARREAQHRATAAELAAREAELRMLRYQLNPHFLFNALNSIRAMMPLDAPARDGVDALAGFLRYTLQASPLPYLRLEQEVEAARHYLAVEQLRFGERLRVWIDLDPRVAEVRVPGFILHPLVENAVKHGMASGARPLLIGIHAGESDGYVRIEITNTVGPALAAIPRLDPGDGAGVGLENVRRRVPLYFRDRAKFSIAREDDVVRAVILLNEERVHA
jgi:hypothetical protein